MFAFAYQNNNNHQIYVVESETSVFIAAKNGHLHHSFHDVSKKVYNVIYCVAVLITIIL